MDMTQWQSIVCSVHMIGRLMNFEFLQMEWGKMRQIARSQWKGIILFEYLLGKLFGKKIGSNGVG
jgi:hypothetical protein